MNGSFLKSRSDIQEARLLAEHSPIEKDWGVESLSDKGLLHTEVEGKVLREHVDSEVGNYMEYYHQVQQAINEGKPAPVTAEDGLSVIKVVKAAFKSNSEKIVVTL
jgi:predicted dehydrogenase